MSKKVMSEKAHRILGHILRIVLIILSIAVVMAALQITAGTP